MCPRPNARLLDKEISLVKSLDNRPILITDSGEIGDWVRARRRGDVFGTTMYRIIWKKGLGYFRYPLPPTWFQFKNIISGIISGGLFKHQKVIVIEMQAEAWGPYTIPFITLDEQFKSMDFDKFKSAISYSKRTGFNDIYLWGDEWWYWLKTTQNHPEFWEYAKKLF